MTGRRQRQQEEKQRLSTDETSGGKQVNNNDRIKLAREIRASTTSLAKRLHILIAGLIADGKSLNGESTSADDEYKLENNMRFSTLGTRGKVDAGRGTSKDKREN